MEHQAKKPSLNQQKGVIILERPIILCGYPKSGTTLLLALLDYHPDLLVFPEETRFFTTVVTHPERQNMEYLLTKTPIRALQEGEVNYPSGYRDYRDFPFDTFAERCVAEWQKSGQSLKGLLESILFAYARVTNQEDKKYWVEKSPSNELFLEYVENSWQDFKAVYILRDPRDNFASLRLSRQKRNRPAPSVAFFASEWAKSLLAWMSFVEQHPDKGFFMRYYDLVSEPEDTLKKLSVFLGIDWHPGLLTPTRNGVFWSGNSVHGEQHQTISTASLGKYKETLSSTEIAYLEIWLGKLMSHFSWQLENPPTGKVSRFGEIFNPEIGTLKEKALLYNQVRTLEKKLL